MYACLFRLQSQASDNVRKLFTTTTANEIIELSGIPKLRRYHQINYKQDIREITFDFYFIVVVLLLRASLDMKCHFRHSILT